MLKRMVVIVLGKDKCSMRNEERLVLGLLSGRDDGMVLEDLLLFVRRLFVASANLIKAYLPSSFHQVMRCPSLARNAVLAATAADPNAHKIPLSGQDSRLANHSLPGL